MKKYSLEMDEHLTKVKKYNFSIDNILHTIRTLKDEYNAGEKDERNSDECDRVSEDDTKDGFFLKNWNEEQGRCEERLGREDVSKGCLDEIPKEEGEEKQGAHLAGKEKGGEGGEFVKYKRKGINSLNH